jgi:hypothetical protein
MRVDFRSWIPNTKLLEEATEDDCPDCKLVLDAILTSFSLTPDLQQLPY